MDRRAHRGQGGHAVEAPVDRHVRRHFVRATSSRGTRSSGVQLNAVTSLIARPCSQVIENLAANPFASMTLIYDHLINVANQRCVPQSAFRSQRAKANDFLS
jgi:hypothetical protein